MKILAIDDEQLTQNFLQQVLQKEHAVQLAASGEEGIRLAGETKPELIILDVRMPGMDGYETCQRLKQDPATANIPVLFLSANTELEEQMQGYAAGGDDYLIKPCEPKTLLAKVNVMLRLKEHEAELKQQYNEAQKTAHIAMLGSSEIGLGLQFIEQSYLISDYPNLASALFAFTNNLQLSCAVMFFTDQGPQSFVSEGTTSPLEIELLEKMREQKRIFDFQNRSFFNYPNVTLLVKNMPVHDADRNGRLTDLLPTILGALNNKILTMKASTTLESHADELKVSFDSIKTTLLQLTNSLGESANKSNKLMRQLYSDMQDFLPKLALDEDQESFILDHIEHTSHESNELNKSTTELAATLQSVANTLQYVIDKQQNLVNDFKPGEPAGQADNGPVDLGSNVDFF